MTNPISHRLTVYMTKRERKMLEYVAKASHENLSQAVNALVTEAFYELKSKEKKED